MKEQTINIDNIVKSQKSDGTVKSSRCKARKSRGVKRTYSYAATTRDAAERRRWTFCEAVNIDNIDIEIMRQTIHKRLPELQQRYGIKSLGIFGSYVHGRQTKRSDIDLLVEFDNQVPVTLVGFVALERELGTLLGCRVDLVERNTLKPAIGNRILAEVVQI